MANKLLRNEDKEIMSISAEILFLQTRVKLKHLLNPWCSFKSSNLIANDNKNQVIRYVLVEIFIKVPHQIKTMFVLHSFEILFSALLLTSSQLFYMLTCQLLTLCILYQMHSCMWYASDECILAWCIIMGYPDGGLT